MKLHRDNSGPRPYTPYPNCQNPQLIRQDLGGNPRPVYFPCGYCYSCLGRKVRVKAGQIFAECHQPYYREHADPGMQLFLTLTYNDTALPMTVPKPHDLSKNFEGTGPFAGRIPEPAPGVPAHTRVDGQHYRVGPTGAPLRPFTDAELAVAHRAHLRAFFKWSDADCDRWESGSYAAASTLNPADITGFLMRLRTWVSRHHPELPPLRFAVTGEYGDQRGRPHYHLILLGYPNDRDAVEFLYFAWRGYHLDSNVHPDLMDALHNHAHLLRPGTAAANYQAKDLAKTRRDMRASPEWAGRVPPFVRQSDKPSMGAAYCEDWLESDVLPIILGAGSDELQQCLAVRKRFHSFAVTVKGQTSVFITSDFFRDQVRAMFSEEVWARATEVLMKAANQAQAPGTLAGLGALDEHCRAVTEKNRRNADATERRKRGKTLRRVPSASLEYEPF